MLWLQLSDPLTVGMFGDLPQRYRGTIVQNQVSHNEPTQKMNLLYGDVQQQLCQHGYNGQDEESRQGINGPHCRGTDAA